MSKCSYNGTILYALPEWNKKTHPYALIRKKFGGDYVLVLSTTRPFYTLGAIYYSSPHLESVSRYTQNAYGAWGELTEEDSTGYAASEAIWTNTDILNEDGTLYLAASEPVPILAPALDPLSLFMGWKAGNWVARQRGKKKTPVAYLYNGVRLP